MTAEPRGSDPTQPKNPSMSSSKEKLFKSASFLDDEAPSLNSSYEALEIDEKREGLHLITKTL